MDYAGVSPERQALARQLDATIGRASAQAHAALKQLAVAAAAFDEIGGWGDPGIRSFTHWLAINAGFDMHSGAELLRVGKALQVLRRISDAFGAGRLSFDKVRQITTVATPATEMLLLEIALGASGQQLARICASLRRIAATQASDHDQRQLAERGLWTRYDEDGMMRLTAMLPAEDAAVVMAALETITASKPLPDQPATEVEDPAHDRWAARRADALVTICENVVAGETALTGSRPTRQVVVHVDAGVLTHQSPDGTCFIEGGAPISAGALRRIGCDAQVVAITERDGLPIDAGRKQRIVSERLRLALEVRDHFCRFPGCGVPAHRTHAHHIEHWADGGATDRDNLVLLCSFHHHRLHDGGYVIRKLNGGIRFEAHDGHLIGSRSAAPLDSERQTLFHPEAARAEWGGATMDFDHAIWALTHNIEMAHARGAAVGDSP
ncbi:MAG TPA: DUF222 domain-containing protein [Candidatus Dormibacteraeota bacterium]|jgi:hypothetical protein